MSASTSKARFLSGAYTAMKRHYGRKKQVAERAVLEQLIFGILLENGTDRAATDGLRRLRSQYVDWNEVRVSSDRELEYTLQRVREATAKGGRIRRILANLFNRYHCLKTPSLEKLSLRDAAKRLRRVDGTNDFAVSSVVQQTLGGHAVPTDEMMRRVMARLGICKENVSLGDLQGSLERLITKARAYAFGRLVQELASDVCVATTPRCARCPLAKMCPTGKERLAAKTRPAKAKAITAKAAKSARSTKAAKSTKKKTRRK